MPLGKSQFLIKPSNNTTDGFSHNKGNPVIKFSIPEQNLLLETTTLRLMGRVQFYDSADTLISEAGSQDDMSVNGGGGASVGLKTPVALNLSNLGGLHNVVDKVVIKSKKSSVELVNDSNYAQFTAVREGFSFNKSDYLRSPLNRHLSTGNNCNLLNRKVVNSYNDATAPERVGQDFSFKLNIPFLSRQPIHLGPEFVGGLMITIYLAPDSNVFFNRFRHNDFNNAQNDKKGSYYKLKNLRLTGRYVVPDANDLKNYQQQVITKNRVNLINDVVSSVNSNGYTPQVQFVRSMVNQFQKGDAINNFNLNSNNFPQVVGLEQVVQSKNNVRFPYEFPVKCVPNARSQTTTGVGMNASTLKHKSDGIGDTEVRLHYQRAVLGAREPYHSSTSLQEAEDQAVEEYATQQANEDIGNNCFVDLAGVGADYSMSLGMTQNFVNQDYSLELTSGVNTGRATLPVDSASQTLLQQTFVNDVEVLDTKTLIKSF